MLEFKKVLRDEILGNIQDKKGDSFARTIVAKCKTYELWDYCYGAYDGEQLVGVFLTTYTKRAPKTANLQLLFTYSRFRHKGYAEEMVRRSIEKAYEDGCSYFRVSSEATAKDFYSKIGFKFHCTQKSGTFLGIFKLTGNEMKPEDFELDEAMEKMFFRKGRGGCVELLG